MRVLITGGAGFIGSHLAEYVHARGDEVDVIDDLSTGRVENLKSLRRGPRFHFTEGSVSDQETLEPLVEAADVIYHLAASVGVQFVVQHLVESIKNNVFGTRIVLETANRFQKKVLLTSTSEVYGRSSERPFHEEDDLRMGPTHKTRWSYACSKALDEYYAFAFFYESQLPITIVRLFNTVGERQSSDYGMVLPTFVEQALTGKPLTIHGSGKQTRCFCHVHDVVPALVQLMNKPDTAGEVYNVGSDQEVSIDELADRVIGVTGSQSVKRYVPYTEAFRVGFDDINRRVPNIEKAQQLIGFQPTLTLDDIIQRVAADVKTKVSMAV